MTKTLIDEAVAGFDEWWHNEGSEAPKPGDDMYEHCKRMCKIAWANGAYKALEQLVAQIDTSPERVEKQAANKDVRTPNCGTGYCSCVECLFEKSGIGITKGGAA